MFQAQAKNLQGPFCKESNCKPIWMPSMYNVFKLLRTQFTAGLFWRLINRNFSFLCYFLSLSCFFKIICVVTRAWYFLTFMFMETKNAIRSTHFNSLLGSFQTANICSGKWDTCKKCKNYKYLPYILRCRSVDLIVNHCKLVFTFFPLYLEQ